MLKNRSGYELTKDIMLKNRLGYKLTKDMLKNISGYELTKDMLKNISGYKLTKDIPITNCGLYSINILEKNDRINGLYIAGLVAALGNQVLISDWHKYNNILGMKCNSGWEN